ncbi:hypothetical protein EVAR_39488_1 [Eumeta japonica]|uniref:Uncharacterized protein n=1 Tax=Eumeta variegata TaxID=151549 RepID=A0A4C1W1W7_EUMVA|nr:hypothetical protein EVAR_39488_1 [Eumeta japonica]
MDGIYECRETRSCPTYSRSGDSSERARARAAVTLPRTRETINNEISGETRRLVSDLRLRPDAGGSA